MEYEIDLFYFHSGPALKYRYREILTTNICCTFCVVNPGQDITASRPHSPKLKIHGQLWQENHKATYAVKYETSVLKSYVLRKNEIKGSTEIWTFSEIFTKI